MSLLMFLIGDNFLFALLVGSGLLYIIGLTIGLTFLVTLYGYAPWFYDRAEVTGRRDWPWLRRWRLWQCCRRCFHHQIVLHPDEHDGAERSAPILYACQPHGVNALSFFFTFLVESPEITARIGQPTGAIFNTWFNVPVMREAMLALGAVNVHPRTLNGLLRGELMAGAEIWDEDPRDDLSAPLSDTLRTARSVALIPEGTGGIAPPTDARLQRPRKLGFLKLFWRAGQQGVRTFDLAFVWFENEDKVYWSLGRNWAFRQWMLDWIGFAITPYMGALPLHPLRTHISGRFTARKDETWPECMARWLAFEERCLRAWRTKQD